MTCRMTMNSLKNIRMEMYPLMINLLKIIYQIRLVSFLISQVIEWQLKILRRMYFSNYSDILRNLGLNQHFRPISTGSISIQPIAGLKEINGKIYYILIRRQIRVRAILNSNKSGPGDACVSGVQCLQAIHPVRQANGLIVQPVG